MRGTYRGEERAVVRALWRRDQTPHFMTHETDPLKPFLEGRSSLVAIDAGANKGFWTKAFLQSFKGRVRHVYMIDASPENFRELRNKEDSLLLEAEDFERSSAHHFAVGETSGKITLYTNEDGSPLSSVFRQEDATNGLPPLVTAFDVPLDCIDNFVRDNGIGHVDVLKVDVEGNELNVFTGARACLEGKKIDVIQFEFGINQIEPRHFFKDFYSLFAKYGFDLYLMGDQGSLTAIPTYSSQHEIFSCCKNFLAVRRLTEEEKDKRRLQSLRAEVAEIEKRLRV